PREALPQVGGGFGVCSHQYAETGCGYCIRPRTHWSKYGGVPITDHATSHRRAVVQRRLKRVCQIYREFTGVRALRPGDGAAQHRQANEISSERDSLTGAQTLSQSLLHDGCSTQENTPSFSSSLKVEKRETRLTGIRIPCRWD